MTGSIEINCLYIKRGLQYIFSGIPEKIVKPNISYLAPNARLLDKKIVITGGGRGLGYAMAKKFSSEGATVLISGRNEDKLKEVSQELGCKWLLLDVQKDETFQEFINKECGNVVLSVDGRSQVLSQDLQLHIERSQRTIKLVRINGQTFMQSLKDKLHWGK